MSDTITGAGDARPGTRVQSVQRAGAVLNALLLARSPMTAIGLARATDIHRTNVHRLLRTMRELEFVTEHPAGHYQLGPATLLYGNAFAERQQIRRVALPYLVDLSNRVVRDRPWVVALAIPIGADAVLIERIWQSHAPLDSILDIGTRLSMRTSAHGRAMLSAYPPEVVAHTLGAPAASEMAEGLAASAAAGHVAYSSNEFRPGISALAAAVLDGRGHPAGSLAISGIELEAQLRLDSELAQHLRRAAEVIAAGCTGTTDR